MSNRALGLVIIALGIVGPLSPVGGAAEFLLIAVLVFCVWRVPLFGWNMLKGGAGGAVAGVVVLGPGLRLAMRTVAIADPVRETEFTIGGTLFVVIGLGLVFGAISGSYFVPVGRMLGLWGAKLAILPMVGILMFLLRDSVLRSELTDLGFGAWMNVPMFSAIAFAYGWAALRFVDRIERGSARRPSIEPARVS